MYRYSPHMRGANDSGAQVRRRFHSVVTLLLLVAVIGLGIFGGNAMKYQSSAHNLFVRKLQVECSTALQLCNTLSRTAGSSSSSTLGKIRQHIYSMQTINDLNVGLSGSSGWLVQETYFSNLYSMLDEYETKLITGMTTGDYQTKLLQTLTNLYTQVQALE